MEGELLMVQDKLVMWEGGAGDYDDGGRTRRKLKGSH